MFRKSSYRYLMMIAGAVLMTGAALAGTFGTVVPIGGQAADIALDTSRSVLYIANFTANRIDVMSLATNQIHTSINVDPNPSSVSLSPDNHWLLVAHYGNTTIGSQQNELTLIDLTAANSKQVFALGNPPLGVAFGLDDKALVVTTTDFVLFDPALGTTQVLQTIGSTLPAATIPALPASFPGNIVQASLATSKDMLTVGGLGGSPGLILTFKYTVADHTIKAQLFTSSPNAGPRTVSVADDGSMFSFAWWTTDSNLNSLGEYNGDPNGPYGLAGLLNVGSHVIDTTRGLIYAHIPPAGTSATVNTTTPILQVLDQDNLTLRAQYILRENLTGKSLISDDHNTVYSISDSGVTVLPVGSLSSVPRLTSSTEDLVFRGNFCNRSTSTQTFSITDPGGGNTPFSISSQTPGLTVSPTTGITPAVITVRVDPNTFSPNKGTVVASLPISSTVAVNLPKAVRVLINSQDVSQRGNFVDIPGRVVDVMADPHRNVYYVLVQNKNQVQIYDGSANVQTGTLRTCTVPTSMAITFDQQYMLIGCDRSQSILVYDLDTLQAQAPIVSNIDYVQSIAVSSNAILAATRSAADGTLGIDQIDMVNRTYSRMPALGVWDNGKLDPENALAATSNGGKIIVAGSKGQVMIYDANQNTFTVSRQDFSSLAGAYAASSFNQFVAGNHLLDSSGVKIADLTTSTGNPSGFAFVDQGGFYTTAPSTSAPGVIAQVAVPTGNSIQPTTMVEAPILSPKGFPSTSSTTSSSCTTSTSGSTTVQTCTSTVGSTITTTTQTCNTTNSNGTVTQTCNTTSGSGSTASAAGGTVPDHLHAQPGPAAFAHCADLSDHVRLHRFAVELRSFGCAPADLQRGERCRWRFPGRSRRTDFDLRRAAQCHQSGQRRNSAADCVGQ